MKRRFPEFASSLHHHHQPFPFPSQPPPRCPPQQQQQQQQQQPRSYEVPSPTVPSRDLSAHYAATGERPQNFILCPTAEQARQSNPTRDRAVRARDAVVRASATAPMAFPMSRLREKGAGTAASVLGPGVQFDVVYVLPPPLEWIPEDVERLALGSAAGSPSFLFLWSGSSCTEIERGRALLRGWGFRRAEDICWIKVGRDTQRREQHQKQCEGELLVHTVEHCLVGIKGTVLRDVDKHFVDANVDTDVVVSEEFPGEEMYRRIERFCLGRRRLVLFEGASAPRPGWVTGSLSEDVKCAYDPARYADQLAQVVRRPFLA